MSDELIVPKGTLIPTWGTIHVPELGCDVTWGKTSDGLHILRGEDGKWRYCEPGEFSELIWDLAEAEHKRQQSEFARLSYGERETIAMQDASFRREVARYQRSLPRPAAMTPRPVAAARAPRTRRVRTTAAAHGPPGRSTDDDPHEPDVDAGAR